ncbi:MAG: hypothetical protein H6598_01145 [Flavobacteriales bacterium]|nr:hypothetical protein [Flavobacteriales bacterium]
MRKYDLYDNMELGSPSNLPSLGILTHVDELSRFDMIYVAHKLSLGTELTIKKDEQRSWDDNSLALYYKGFKLGYVSKKTSEIIRRCMDKGKEIKAFVKSLSRQKFLPMAEMDIQIYVM